MTLADIWFVLVAFLLTGYVVLDGFDLGAGVLYPFIARTEDERSRCAPPSARSGTATRCGSSPAAARSSPRSRRSTP